MSSIVQNTPEWLEMRKDKVGASDAPAIMEVDPYCTAYEKWQQKLNLVPSREKTFAMQRGHDLEPVARLELQKLTGISFEPQVILHKSIPWMMASLDGISDDKSQAVEIKCLGTEGHLLACQGKIPDQYYPQLQHQLEVCELDMIHYFSFDGSRGVIIKVYRDDSFIKKMLMKEKIFFECLQELTPPEMTDRDYIVREDEEWKTVAKEWYKITEQIRSLKDQQDEKREKLIKLCEGKSSIGAGVRVNRSFSKGVIDYKDIPELTYVDLEKYRKKPIEKYTFTCI